MSQGSRALKIGAALLLTATVVLAGVGLRLAGRAPGEVTATAAAAVKAKPATRPNVVLILADDLSWNLVSRRFMPHVVNLEKRGETFTNYFVADSLCCPSRSTIFTGMFPHDTHVFTNLGSDGGYDKFQSERLYNRTYAVAMRRRGYLTSMLGKYLNGYGDPGMKPGTAPVPPGWTDWHVSNSSGYAEFNYLLNDNGKINRYGGPGASRCGFTAKPDDYGVDVLNAGARAFIRRSRRKPFVMEVATFAPHQPYIPAPRDACDFPGLKAPRDPSFNTSNINPPAWLGQRKPLPPRQLAVLDRAFRMRAQAVESIDKLVADVEGTLAAEHQLKNTYIVFTSDNGYHIGQHRLTRGKQTAFDTDIRVPLIIAGPGVPKRRTMSQVTQNTDLYPTFVQLSGGVPSRQADGHSLLPLLHPGTRPVSWPTVALVEHHGVNENPSDPDFDQGRLSGDPTTYEAIRISRRHLPHFKGPVKAVYVEYRDAAHELEYYDLRRDPHERDNTAGRLTSGQKSELHRILVAIERCHGRSACWRAALPS
jgi:N-acetylglucosamine-6-sulfatase